MAISAEAIRSLQKFDLRVLREIERLMRKYKWVPDDVLKRATGFSSTELDYRLGRLSGMGLVKSSSVPYKGYHLVSDGYDTLALRSLTQKGTVSALGCLIGEGKESLVYEALGLGVVVLKFHRIGQHSFQSARLKRGYMPKEGHFPWIFASTASAQREFEALTLLHPRVKVPVPIDLNRNVVVMSFIPGWPLNRCTPVSPEETFEEIIDNVRVAYDLGVIHGDLSEFNVMIDGRECWIIDWPQWVDPSHQNAPEILRRDIRNIVVYFRRKFGLEYDEEEVLARVVG